MPVSDIQEKSFDFIICGGGTAGLVLANRLTEVPDFSVLVVEAGSDRRGDPLVQIPGLFQQLYGKPEYDWDFKTTPQKGTLGAVHGWPRGKGLGGSSQINFMMYSHCSKMDLDSWRDVGNEGWGYDDLKPYMEKVEHMHLPNDETRKALSTEYIQPELRGKNGPVHTSFPSSAFNFIQESWVQTSKALGYPNATDPRTGSSLGLFNQLVTVDPRSSTRSYAATTYLAEAEGRSNLTVVTETMVRKILFDRSSGKPRASGVELEDGGTVLKVHAKKEVLLCAGAVQSPQILELSGVGQKEVLRKYGIDVVVDSRGVGENLQDHPLVVLSWEVNDGIPTGETFRDNPHVLGEVMKTYAETRGGPLAAAPTTTGFLSTTSFMPGTGIEALACSGPELPERQRDLLMKQLVDQSEATIQVACIPAGAVTLTRENNVSAYSHKVPGNYLSVGVGLMHAWSRGTIHIKSGDVNQQPEIDPRYLSHPIDLEIQAQALMHMSQKIITTSPLADFVKDASDGSGKLLMPGIMSFGTIEEARERVRERQLTMYHPIGTCAMMPQADGGVVDTELRMYGIDGLRIVDASVFPLRVQGNIMSLVYALAEKAAHLIKIDYAASTSIME
ncbi:Dehydrogenase citC [Pseudocercospora fuligena]|uniref:Dehydrogenase citC n=1 Tax=Pseudocercospora fuligena TaxID=685502 RepID=A0A8H6RN65_9PEZI|nr:Dehydrogenase citC [Pseudocercospora fuligena]